MKKMISKITDKLTSLHLWQLLLIGVFFSEVLTMFFSTLFSFILWGNLSHEVIVIGVIDAFIVALIIMFFTIIIVKRIRMTEIVNKQLIEEIEERKRSEAENEKLQSRLRQVQKMEAIGTLAGGIAHDFNNMLAIILGNSELASGALSEGPVQKNILQIQKAALRSKELVAQILTFSRKEESIKRAPFYLCHLIEDSMDSLRVTIPTSVKIKINISNKCREGISSCKLVLVDATQFHQILLNICINAVHAMDEKGVLEITLTEELVDEETSQSMPGLKSGIYERLVISDTGSGMSQEIMDRIFDPFYTTKKVEEGTGMGLSVVHGIIENNDSKIFVESELGKGSRFIVYFPVCEKSEEKITSEIENIPLGVERILLVDDEEFIIAFGKTMLEKLGYSVTATSDSTEALELVQNNLNQFDLIISDQTMPNLSGMEFAEKVLSIKPDFPIIICTGYSSKINKDKIKELGIQELVDKPFKISEIASAIRKVLKRKGM